MQEVEEQASPFMHDTVIGNFLPLLVWWEPPAKTLQLLQVVATYLIYNPTVAEEVSWVI